MIDEYGVTANGVPAPNVTEDDLRAHHASHFGNATVPTDFFVSDPELEYEEDDGLGYYADGTKRTLTEDQVAMFRHSEIQALLRERQLAKDSLEADKRMSRPEASSAEEDVHSTSTQTKATTPGKTVTLEKSTVSKKLSSANEVASDQAKRKWEHFIDDSEKNTGFRTHRRMARELDELQQDSVDLAYGEEEVPARLSKQPLADIMANPAPPPFQWPSLCSDGDPT